MGGIYFLIPLYNEEKIIGSVLRQLMGQGFSKIVIVNDGSTDNSAQIVKMFEGVLLINHLINRGQGAALATGLEYLSDVEDCEYVVTFDADGQHQLGDVIKMVNILKNNADLDIIMGSRFIEKSKSNVPYIRKIILKFGVFFLQFMYGLRISDAHNGLRVIRQSVIHKMIPKLDDFSHASEILYLIKTNKFNYQECPTQIIYSEYSLEKGQHSLNAIKIALKTIWHKINVLIFE